MAGPIRIAILAQALAAQKGVRNVTGDLKELGKTADKADKPTSKISDTVGKLTKSAAGAAKAVGGAIAPIAAVASAAVTAAPAVAAAGAALINVAKAAGGAAPALAAIGAAALFVKLTLTQIAPAIGKSMQSITDAFKKAGAAAGELASKGIAPLARQFAKVGIPIVSDAMDKIAVSTNEVVKGFLAWANSASGLNTLREITFSTADAFAKVSPHVLALSTALLEMIGRISRVSLAAGSSGLNGVLDALTRKLNTITGASVQKGLDDLKRTFLTVRDVVVKVGEVVRTAIGIYRQYQAEILVISDVLAVLAIVFGGPVTAIIAAVGLIVRHMDFVKNAIAQVRAAFSAPGSTVFLDQIRTAVATVWPVVVAAFNAIRAAVMPTLIEITQKVRTELVPALGEFIAAAAPVVAFFIERFAPIIAASMKTVAGIISGAVTIISGIFKVFTGLLNGDWAQLWAGIKTIVRGAVGIVKTVIGGFVTVIKGYFSAARGAISALWSGLWRLVITAAQSAARNVGTVLSGLVETVRARFQAVRDAVQSRMAAAVQVVKTAVGRIKSAVNVDLYSAGAKIIQSLINGITSRAGAVTDKISSIAGTIRDYFPFSPAKRGPLKRKPMTKAGQNIIRDLARGMARNAQIKKMSGIAAGLAGQSAIDAIHNRGTERPVTAPVQYITNINGLVGDPVEIGRQIDRAHARYLAVQGRTA